MIDSIARDVELEAGPEDVWDAISNPERLREWLADDVQLSLTPGGEASFVLDGEPRSGWVEEVCRPDETGSGRLAFWWQASGEPASRVSIELMPGERGGTRLRIQESRPLEVLDVVGIPLCGHGGQMRDSGGQTHGPALVAA
jgi:uncharacterized protein YndB with AHSA1/START domain